jgi:hypothetical protein
MSCIKMLDIAWAIGKNGALTPRSIGNRSVSLEISIGAQMITRSHERTKPLSMCILTLVAAPQFLAQTTAYTCEIRKHGEADSLISPAREPDDAQGNATYMYTLHVYVALLI